METLNRNQSLTSLDGIVTELPRGGYLVDTSLGYIQFGSPPETIKDTMLLPKGVPSIFILPYDHFDPGQGVSMAEIEFPIYYNYFLKNRRAHIFVNPDHLSNLKIVLQEAIFGPEQLDISSEVEMTPGAYVPDIMSEMRHFRGDRRIEDLVDIRPIPAGGFKIKDLMVIPRKDRGFNVFDVGRQIAEIPAKLKFQVRYDLGKTLHEPFVPPKFAITCLGPSHGFDPEQNTSGFLLWINKVGVMVDPPVNSTQWLRDSNVNPKLIDSIILTHCHADHDSGTFQKILEETKVNIYTTPTIMQSFLRKYSALTRMPVPVLLGLINFHPVRMNQPVNIHGGIFNFYYSLHSIPTIGFHFIYRNRTFLYSSDHLNEPTLIGKMFEAGVISRERRDFLVNFPWHYDIIYHEAGIPPLHTPVSYLASLPAEVQKKITVYHIAAKSFPAGTGLKLAKFGIGETVYPDVHVHKFEEAYEVLDAFSRIEIFQGLPSERFKDLLLSVTTERFNRGDTIIHKGTAGDKFYVITLGNVSVEGVENIEDKVYGTFEYFGEASLVFGTPRTANVVAATNVEAFSIDKESFLRLIRGTPVEQSIQTIAATRDGVSWSVIKANPFFRDLSSSQVTQLETILSAVDVRDGEELAAEGKKYDAVWLIVEGEVESFRKGAKVRKFGKGDLVGNVFEIREQRPSAFSYRTASDGKMFKIGREGMSRFLVDNPGVLMKMLFEEKSGLED